MTPKVRAIITQAGSIVLAVGLLYVALRGVDFGDVGRTLRHANYAWLLPLVIAVLAAHWLRALRWTLLIEVLPHPENGGTARVSPNRAFSALMIGYLVNCAAPRLGEVARSANVARTTDHTFSSIFGTVVVERVLDVFSLLLAAVPVSILLYDQRKALLETYIDPIVQGRDLGLILIAAGVLGLAIALLVFFFRFKAHIETANGSRAYAKITSAMASFGTGMRTLTMVRRKVTLVVTTVLIWSLYGLMAYIPFLILGLQEVHDINLLDAWTVMVIGAIGMTLPLPAGTGSYHYVTIKALTVLFAVPQAAAVTYAVLTHAAQIVLYGVVGFLALTLQRGRR